jgi:hypothetical protein
MTVNSERDGKAISSQKLRKESMSLFESKTDQNINCYLIISIIFTVKGCLMVKIIMSDQIISGKKVSRKYMDKNTFNVSAHTIIIKSQHRIVYKLKTQYKLLNCQDITI